MHIPFDQTFTIGACTGAWHWGGYGGSQEEMRQYTLKYTHYSHMSWMYSTEHEIISINYPLMCLMLLLSELNDYACFWRHYLFIEYSLALFTVCPLACAHLDMHVDLLWSLQSAASEVCRSSTFFLEERKMNSIAWVILTLIIKLQLQLKQNTYSKTLHASRKQAHIASGTKIKDPKLNKKLKWYGTISS